MTDTPAQQAPAVFTLAEVADLLCVSQRTVARMAMTTEERLATLEQEQVETKVKLARLEKALEAQRQEVRVRSFVLVNGDGKPRAKLSTVKDNVELVLMDENGKGRAVLLTDRDGPELILADEKGAARAILSVSKDRQGLAVLGENAYLRAELVAGKDGPLLSLHDENGNAHAELGVNKDGPKLKLERR